MPHITIKMYPGRSEALKQKLCEELVQSTVKALSVPEGAVSVSIEEVPKEAWGEMVVKPDMLDKPEELYVKPANLQEYVPHFQ